MIHIHPLKLNLNQNLEKNHVEYQDRIMRKKKYLFLLHITTVIGTSSPVTPHINVTFLNDDKDNLFI